MSGWYLRNKGERTGPIVLHSFSICVSQGAGQLHAVAILRRIESKPTN